MKTPHKHATLIHAYADGAEIQLQNSIGEWTDEKYPTWNLSAVYRLKPEPKPDLVVERMVCVTAVDDDTYITLGITNYSNCRFVFDGETGKLKSVEVL
jgi:hypothetical protein